MFFVVTWALKVNKVEVTRGDIVNSTLRYYLGEVLGLDLVPAAHQPKVQSPAVAVLCGYDLNDAEEILLRKMMQAIGVTDYTVWDVPPTGTGWGLVLGSSGEEALGLNELGSSTEHEGYRWIRTYALGDLLKGSEGEIQSRKRIAWGHLQAIKNWMKESNH